MRLFRNGVSLSVRIHRNLNHGEPWVLTCKAEGRRRVASAVLRVDSVKVSAATLARIRTPKGERTPSGAQGIGKRTVGAWLVGDLLTTSEATPTGATVHFNPFKDDTFKIQRGGEFSPLVVREPLTLRFNADGTVEVVA